MRAKSFTAAVLLLGFSAASGQVTSPEAKCATLERSGDGTPAEFLREKCLAKIAMERKEWSEAEKHLRTALAVQLFEAPNYDLKLELGLATCSQGLTSEGKAILFDFICLAKADLGDVRCEAVTNEPPRDACQQLACDGTGSTLSNEGRTLLGQRLVHAQQALEACDGA